MINVSPPEEDTMLTAAAVLVPMTTSGRDTEAGVVAKDHGRARAAGVAKPAAGDNKETGAVNKDTINKDGDSRDRTGDKTITTVTKATGADGEVVSTNKDSSSKVREAQAGVITVAMETTAREPNNLESKLRTSTLEGSKHVSIITAFIDYRSLLGSLVLVPSPLCV